MMLAAKPDMLINGATSELWPSWLLRARSNADARLLAQHRWVLRDKADGRYLAVADGTHQATPSITALRRSNPASAAWQAALAPWQRSQTSHVGNGKPTALPLHGLTQRLATLGLDADAYAQRTGLALMPEPDWLQLAGLDRYRRPLWLHPQAARAWQHLQRAAATDGIQLEAISGYRSHAYQLGIFKRKRSRGLSVDAILKVNAAPGFSEHHTGLALDISSPGEPPAEESFEHTTAFAWLSQHAADHGFYLSYPRNNPHGIVYEPWHWAWRGRAEIE